MTLGHEKLDAYRLSIGYVAWVYEKAEGLNENHRAARDQWLRASQSIPLNIAEGNGKTAEPDRRRYFEIARGSVLECAAIQDVLVVGKALDEAESQGRKRELDRMTAMLSRLGGRVYQVREKGAGYGDGFDPDPDPDRDPDFGLGWDSDGETL
ncbi:MAG TPA: four helix bundle protein [Gammaproteobacteria bacterium]|nr:four helix bundle protein [Gammaproteobacteria bacterium]